MLMCGCFGNKCSYLHLLCFVLFVPCFYIVSFVYIYSYLLCLCGSGSSVGIATGYGLDGPGIESGWGRDFTRLSRPALGLLYNGYRVFPGRRKRTGRYADPSPPSSAEV
jgi:hypothetical protein